MANLKELTDQYYDLMENVYNIKFSLTQLQEKVQERLTTVEVDIAASIDESEVFDNSDAHTDALIEYEDTDEGNQKIKEKNALEDLISDIGNFIDKLEV